jgi:hypothetical protein
VYGSNGNRWWVGQNVGETGGNSTIFGSASIVSDKPSGYQSLPSGNATDDAQFTAAAAKDKGSKSPVTISVENIKRFNVQGPYTTQAQANAAIPAIQSANPAQGSVEQEKNSGTPVASQAAGAVQAATSWTAALQGLIQGIESGNLWVRVAKIAIGGTILIVGLAKLTGADKAVGGVASKAVEVAPFL